MENLIDRASGWFATRYHNASLKFRTPDKVPPYVRHEVLLSDLGIRNDQTRTWSRERQAQIAARISWIYSDITKLSNEVSGAEIEMVTREDKQRDITHPLEEILRFPNPFFDGSSLFSYLVWGLQLGEYGAYWYLAPNKVTGELEEIWPIPIDRITPVRHKTKYISHYLYTSRNRERKPLIIPVHRIVNFKYAHPWDLYRNFTPLEAAGVAMEHYIGISTQQRDLFTKGRGVPLAVVSLDPNISEDEFPKIREQLREDWEEQRRIAITRSGTMSVATVGISNRDLETVASQNFNRDELDSIFMGGIPWRSDQFKSGDGLREANKQVKENVVFPLHKMIAKQMHIGLTIPYYGNEHIGVFQDIRAQDRSIQLQERNVYWRVKTLDEARQDLGYEPYPTDTELGDLGSLPVGLAANAQFVMALNEIGVVPEALGVGSGGTQEKEKDQVGNLPGSRDAEALTNELATGGEGFSVDIKGAAGDGMRAELKRWRKVCLKLWDKSVSAQALVDREFESDKIFSEVRDDIIKSLVDVQSQEDIYGIFKKWL